MYFSSSSYECITHVFFLLSSVSNVYIMNHEVKPRLIIRYVKCKPIISFFSLTIQKFIWIIFSQHSYCLTLQLAISFTFLFLFSFNVFTFNLFLFGRSDSDKEPHNRKCRLCKLIIENVWGSASKYQKCRVPILQAPNELAVHYWALSAQDSNSYLSLYFWPRYSITEYTNIF